MTHINALAPMIQVRDLNQSIAFYRDILGFTVESAWPEDAPVWSMLRSGAAMLMLSSFDGVSQPTLTGTLYFYPGDTTAMWEQIRERVKVAEPLAVREYGMREFSIYDPDSYLLSFGESTEDTPDHDQGHPHDHEHGHTH